MRALIGKEFAAKIGEGNDVFLRAAFGSGSTVMSMQDPIIQDVFAASTAAFLMTRFSSAPVGDALELVLTSTGAGITADRTARTAAGSLTARTLTPKAIRAVYDINKTALQRFRGLGVVAALGPAESDQRCHRPKRPHGFQLFRFHSGPNDQPDQPEHERHVLAAASPRWPRPSTACTPGRSRSASSSSTRTRLRLCTHCWRATPR